MNWHPQDSLDLGNSTEQLNLSLLDGESLAKLSPAALLGWASPEPALGQGLVGLEAAVTGEEL